MFNPSKYKYESLSKLLHNCAMLMEASGVAMSEYFKLIECITDDLYQFIQDHGYKDIIEIEINKTLKDYNINPTLEDLADKIYIYCFPVDNDTSAEYSIHNTKIKSDGHIEAIYIAVNMDIMKFNNLRALFLTLLYHELNHAVDDIMRIKHNKPALKIYYLIKML